MPTYAVIFSSTLKPDSPGYEEAARRMLDQVSRMPGYLGVDSARGPDGKGITVSYWDSLEAIRAWGQDPEHRKAQRTGNESYYSDWKLRIAKIEEERWSATR